MYTPTYDYQVDANGEQTGIVPGGQPSKKFACGGHDETVPTPGGPGTFYTGGEVRFAVLVRYKK